MISKQFSKGLYLLECYELIYYNLKSANNFVARN